MDGGGYNLMADDEQEEVLSQDQQAAWDKILHAVSMRSSLKYTERMFYLSGEAGTGKSYLVRRLVKHLGRRRVALTAPTGMAAQNIDGVTMHSYFGLNPSKLLDDNEGIRCNMKKLTEKIELGGVRMLVLDEVSMLSAGYFNVVVNLLRRFDVVMLFVGDFLQLPPVPDYDLPEPFQQKAFESSMWKFVQPIYLTEAHRQVEDPEFLDILRDLRYGELTPRLEKLFQERTFSHLPDYAPALLPFRNKVAEVNDRRLEALGEEICTFNAFIKTRETKRNRQGKEVQAMKEETILKKMERHRIPNVLRYCVGAQIVMLTNDQTKQWVNGSTGVVVDTVLTGEGQKIVVIDLDKGRQIRVCPLAHEILDSSGDPVATFVQFPFQLAWALTIHKVQGMTLDCVGVDLGGHFAAGMTYVAVSRCIRREGLFFIGWIAELKVDEAALEVMA
jgi:ATP-dependent exoDNAse (exonuclease V) alpha subunit